MPLRLIAWPAGFADTPGLRGEKRLSISLVGGDGSMVEVVRTAVRLLVVANFLFAFGFIVTTGLAWYLRDSFYAHIGINFLFAFMLSWFIAVTGSVLLWAAGRPAIGRLLCAWLAISGVYCGYMVFIIARGLFP